MMEAETKSESEVDSGVTLTDGRLTYRKPKGHLSYDGPIEVFNGKIERREVNQYTTVETKHRSFESTVSSNDKREGAFLLSINDAGEYRVTDLHSPDTKVGGDSNTAIGQWLWSGEWDCEIADGIMNKTVRDWSDTNESGAVKRTKIEREAVDRADENGERLFVLRYKTRKGGSAGSRASPSERWNSVSTERVLELVPAGQ